ncbi:MAG: hypothetical protein AAFV53_11415, partial [Myxococcota bacterium]
MGDGGGEGRKKTTLDMVAPGLRGIPLEMGEPRGHLMLVQSDYPEIKNRATKLHEEDIKNAPRQRGRNPVEDDSSEMEAA